jgi:hypothetical protein
MTTKVYSKQLSVSPPHVSRENHMSGYKISELKSKKKSAITRIASLFFFSENCNYASRLIKISTVLCEEFDIRRERLYSLQLNKLTTYEILTMNLRQIQDENGMYKFYYFNFKRTWYLSFP